MMVRLYDGDRDMLRPLFREADDSESQIDAYLGLADVFVADDELVGHLQLIADQMTPELKSMAVVESRRGTGIGHALIDVAAQRCFEHAATRLFVATAAADVGNLRFYQRQGFRMLRIERDAFGIAAGYADGIVIDGIPLRDRVWLDRDLSGQS